MLLEIPNGQRKGRRLRGPATTLSSRTCFRTVPEPESGLDMCARAPIFRLDIAAVDLAILHDTGIRFIVGVSKGRCHLSIYQEATLLSVDRLSTTGYSSVAEYDESEVRYISCRRPFGCRKIAGRKDVAPMALNHGTYEAEIGQ